MSAWKVSAKIYRNANKDLRAMYRESDDEVRRLREIIRLANQRLSAQPLCGCSDYEKQQGHILPHCEYGMAIEQAKRAGYKERGDIFDAVELAKKNNEICTCGHSKSEHDDDMSCMVWYGDIECSCESYRAEALR